MASTPDVGAVLADDLGLAVLVQEAEALKLDSQAGIGRVLLLAGQGGRGLLIVLVGLT